MNLARYKELSLETQDDKERYRLLERVLEHECGYDRVVSSMVTGHPSMGMEAVQGITRNYPEEWMKRLHRAGIRML